MLTIPLRKCTECRFLYKQFGQLFRAVVSKMSIFHSIRRGCIIRQKHRALSCGTCEKRPISIKHGTLIEHRGP